jgi:hypothetical protein
LFFVSKFQFFIDLYIGSTPKTNENFVNLCDCIETHQLLQSISILCIHLNIYCCNFINFITNTGIIENYSNVDLVVTNSIASIIKNNNRLTYFSCQGKNESVSIKKTKTKQNRSSFEF